MTDPKALASDIGAAAVATWQGDVPALWAQAQGYLPPWAQAIGEASTQVLNAAQQGLSAQSATSAAQAGIAFIAAEAGWKEEGTPPEITYATLEEDGDLAGYPPLAIYLFKMAEGPHWMAGNLPVFGSGFEHPPHKGYRRADFDRQSSAVREDIRNAMRAFVAPPFGKWESSEAIQALFFYLRSLSKSPWFDFGQGGVDLLPILTADMSLLQKEFDAFLSKEQSKVAALAGPMRPLLLVKALGKKKSMHVTISQEKGHRSLERLASAVETVSKNAGAKFTPVPMHLAASLGRSAAPIPHPSKDELLALVVAAAKGHTKPHADTQAGLSAAAAEESPISADALETARSLVLAARDGNEDAAESIESIAADAEAGDQAAIEALGYLVAVLDGLERGTIADWTDEEAEMSDYDDSDYWYAGEGQYATYGAEMIPNEDLDFYGDLYTHLELAGVGAARAVPSGIKTAQKGIIFWNEPGAFASPGTKQGFDPQPDPPKVGADFLEGEDDPEYYEYADGENFYGDYYVGATRPPTKPKVTALSPLASPLALAPLAPKVTAIAPSAMPSVLSPLAPLASPMQAYPSLPSPIVMRPSALAVPSIAQELAALRNPVSTTHAYTTSSPSGGGSSASEAAATEEEYSYLDDLTADAGYDVEDYLEELDDTSPPDPDSTYGYAFADYYGDDDEYPYDGSTYGWDDWYETETAADFYA